MRITIMKKKYTKPIITRILLDNVISLQMQSSPGNPPDPRAGGNKGKNDPFQSPFGNKPFG
jgi:hypothetical protein